MLLLNKNAGDTAIISKNKNPQLEVKGFKTGVAITIDKKTNNDFVIDLNGNKYRITAAQARQINVY